MTNLNIRFFLTLSLVLVLALVFSALDQSLNNDILMAVLDAQAVAVDGVMTPFMLDTPVSNDWVGVSCEELNNLAGDTIVDFSDKALIAKLELCNSL